MSERSRLIVDDEEGILRCIVHQGCPLFVVNFHSGWKGLETLEGGDAPIRTQDAWH